MLQRIGEAARQLFAERGYASTTTREIARLADVSETLLFRYYGDKATLFGEVVIAPFHRLMADFVELHPDPTADFGREADTRRFTRRVYELFEGNEEMFRALLTGGAPLAAGQTIVRALLTGPSLPGEDEGAPGLGGLTPFFDQSVHQVQQRYASAGLEPPFDLGIGVRLGFGMIAASVILRNALFPDKVPDRDVLVGVLEHLIANTLAGPPFD